MITRQLTAFLKQYRCTRNHWVSGLCAVSGILNTRKTFRNWVCFRPQVSAGGGGGDTQLGPFESANRNHGTETDPVFETLICLVIRIPDDGQSPETQLSWELYIIVDPEVQVRFPALPHFLRSSGSGTGFTQPREYNWGATWKKK
jgi:hypothetical protein